MTDASEYSFAIKVSPTAKITMVGFATKRKSALTGRVFSILDKIQLRSNTGEHDGNQVEFEEVEIDTDPRGKLFEITLTAPMPKRPDWHIHGKIGHEVRFVDCGVYHGQFSVRLKAYSVFIRLVLLP